MTVDGNQLITDVKTRVTAIGRAVGNNTRKMRRREILAIAQIEAEQARGRIGHEADVTGSSVSIGRFFRLQIKRQTEIVGGGGIFIGETDSLVHVGRDKGG